MQNDLNQSWQKIRRLSAAAVSLFSFSEPGWMNLGYEDDKKVYRNFRMNAIDADFVKTMNLQIITGRNFSKDNPADITSSMMVNEALVKEYGWDDPLVKNYRELRTTGDRGCKRFSF